MQTGISGGGRIDNTIRYAYDNGLVAPVRKGYNQGPRRVKKSEGHTPMASAGARAYNGGLGAEPLAGVQGAEPPVGGQGAKRPAAEEVFVFKTVIFNASATVFARNDVLLSCFFCKVSKLVSKFIAAH